MEKRAFKAERQRDAALEEVITQRSQNDKLKTELEAEKGKNLKLRSQINRDYENSSISSSKSIKHKKISNSREKTGKKPGGQPGHESHRRKKQVPTSKVKLLPPQEIMDDPDFKKTSKTRIKQLIDVRVVLMSWSIVRIFTIILKPANGFMQSFHLV